MKIRFLVLGIFVALLCGCLVYSKAVSSPLKDGSNVIDAKHTELSKVIDDNKDNFHHPIAVKLYCKLHRISITVKKGEYVFPKDIALKDMVTSLQSGKYNTSIKRVTIPEGYTLNQIASVLEKNKIIDKKSFLKACKEYDISKYVSKNSQKRYLLEGFLFPDTYEFETGTSGEKIISTMVNRFDEVIGLIEKEHNVKIANSKIENYVVKASLIEREVVDSRERKVVSSVINNRLKQKMKLQIDASVLYALGTHKSVTTFRDTEVKSPYNTYYVSGLPVGAICNPGRASIEAALFPDKTNYIFYASKDGKTHKFFTNYNDFLNFVNN